MIIICFFITVLILTTVILVFIQIQNFKKINSMIIQKMHFKISIFKNFYAEFDYESSSRKKK